MSVSNQNNDAKVHPLHAQARIICWGQGNKSGNYDDHFGEMEVGKLVETRREVATALIKTLNVVHKLEIDFRKFWRC